MAETDALHEDQIAYWNGAGGTRWVAQQERTDTVMAEIAALTIERARVQPGETVLEIGCGCGGATRGLSQAVGPKGEVLALDVSAPILVSAVRQFSEASNIKFVQGDAASYRFPEGVADLLFSRFGVMFFGDPAAAFANMRRALKPNARMSFACWRGLTENPWMMVPLEAVYEHVPRLPRPEPDAPGAFSFAEPDRVRRILLEASFTEPTLESVDFTLDLASGGGLEAAMDYVAEIGATSRALDGQPAAQIAKAKDSIRRTLAPYQHGGRVALKAGIWIVQARL